MGNRLHSVGISPPSAGVFHTIHRLSHKTGWDFGFPQLLFPDLPVERCGKRGFRTQTPRTVYPPFPPISASENGGGKRNILYNCRFFRKIRPIPRTRRTVAVEKSGKVPVLPPFFQTPARRATRDFSSVLATVSHNSTNFRLQLQEIFGHFREKFHFSTILPPLRRLRLRTNLNISIYKKNNRCADTLLMREIPALRGDHGVRVFTEMQDVPQGLQIRSQSVRSSRIAVREPAYAPSRCGFISGLVPYPVYAPARCVSLRASRGRSER